MKHAMTLLLSLAAMPAMAADEAGYSAPHGLLQPSMGNTDFVVLIGFLLFVAIIFYFNVPALLLGMLDKRAAGIKSDLDEARALREEAQSLLASYERKQREVADQADRIVAQAKADAEAAAEEGKANLERSIARRMQAAEDQIQSAEDKAVQSVRNRAVEVAIAAAAATIGKQISAADANKLIDQSIGEVERHLH
jgi:F-type H+-transporting ATPase subunit b